MKCLLATRSRGKIREISELLRDMPRLELVSLDDLGIEPSPEEEIEIYDTFLENARAKALFFARLSGLPTIADDSGLAVAALNGAPGVHSKRFALDAPLTGEELDAANNRLLLKLLADTPPGERTAHFASVVVLAGPGGETPLTTIGTCTGSITTEPRGESGFGYDPIFLIPELDATFAEITTEEKNRWSHRSRAFYALRAHLSDALGQLPTSITRPQGLTTNG